MPCKKTLLGFFAAIAYSAAVLASDPPALAPFSTANAVQASADEARVSGFFERYTDSITSLVDRSLNFLGVPYRFGGTSPLTGFDCSGFVRKVFSDALGFGLPRTAAEMAQTGEQVNRSELKPGDLVFFNTMRHAFSHVGIYLGNNQFVHAPSAGGVVRVEDMSASYWAVRYNGARRVLPNGQPGQAN